MGKTVAFHNLGCKVNAYETDVMEGQFRKKGYEIVPFTEKADIYVVNTCTVTNIADRKSRQMLHRAARLNPGALVVAAGCYVQVDGERAAQDASVDIVIGNNQKNRVVEIVEAYLEEREKHSETADKLQEVPDIGKVREFESMYMETVNERTRAYVKVQDGCNQFCSYCLIPYARGRVRSRKTEEVTEEITNLVRMGFQEFVLTGIHLSSYGVDFSQQKEAGKEVNLLTLIKAVHQIDGVRRIRLGSLEPNVIREEFVRELQKMPKLCPHFHLSLQSGCDSVLKRMNRHYTTEEYREKCVLLRKYFDNPAITTDVIAGFPGETQEEFEETEAFLKEICFYEAHIFKYSRRKGTRADQMPGQIPEQVKAERSARLLALTKEDAAKYRSQWILKPVEVLFEEETELEDGPGFIGHTKEYVKVGVCTDQNLENQIRWVVPQKMLSEDILYGIIQ